MRLRTALATTALALTLMGPNPATAGGVPTIDTTAIGQMVAELNQLRETYKAELEQLAELQKTYQVAVDTYQTAVAELATLRAQVSSITKVRDIQGLLARINALEATIEASTIGDMVSSAVLEGDPVPARLQASLDRLRETYGLGDMPDFAAAEAPHDRGIADQAGAGMITVATAEAGYDRAGIAIERIDGLMAEVGQQQDLKAAIDFNTRAQLEVALIMADVLRVTSAMAVNTGTEQIAAAQLAAQQRRVGRGRIQSLELTE